jgi:autotransporter-associated beta strand protein
MNSLFGDLFDASSGNFNWIVFDQPGGILGLDVKASTASWTGGGNGSTLWSNASNWKGQIAPAEGFGLIFGETSPISVNNFNNFTSGTKFSGITFDGAAAFDLKGNSIQLAGDVINISTQTQTISLNIVLADATSTFLADSADIVVKGHIDGPQGLVKTGASKLILKNSNSYTGDTTVVEGTLTLDGGDLFDGSTVSLASGTTLEVLSGSPTLGNIVGQGTVSVTGTNVSLTAQSITADSLIIGGNPNASVVPEPSTIVLVALAALMMVGYRSKMFFGQDCQRDAARVQR